MKPEKILKSESGKADPKDTEVYPKPDNYHTIICSFCGKKAKVNKKYTRACDDCRKTKNYKRNMKASDWSGWAHTPAVRAPSNLMRSWGKDNGK